MSVWRVGMRPHRDTLPSRLVQCSKRQIDGGTRRQNGNGRVLRRRILRQRQDARQGAQRWAQRWTREICIRASHAESHRVHEGRHNVRVVRRSPRHTRIREGWRSRHANVLGSFVGCARLLHRRFEAWRHGPTCSIRTREGYDDAAPETAPSHRAILVLHSVAANEWRRRRKMNYDDYYAQQVGGALPYFAGARVQRGHGFGSLFAGLLRSVAPLIKRGALALGNRALKTGAQIAGDVLSGENIRTAAKRRTNTAGRDLLQSLLTTPPGKRVKRAAPKKRIKPRRAEPVKRAAKRRRIAEADVFS